MARTRGARSRRRGSNRPTKEIWWGYRHSGSSGSRHGEGGRAAEQRRPPERAQSFRGAQPVIVERRRARAISFVARVSLSRDRFLCARSTSATFNSRRKVRNPAWRNGRRKDERGRKPSANVGYVRFDLNARLTSCDTRACPGPTAATNKGVRRPDRMAPRREWDRIANPEVGAARRDTPEIYCPRRASFKAHPACVHVARTFVAFVYVRDWRVAVNRNDRENWTDERERERGVTRTHAMNRAWK